MEIIIDNLPDGYWDVFNTETYTRRNRTSPYWSMRRTVDRSKSKSNCQTKFTTEESDDE